MLCFSYIKSNYWTVGKVYNLGGAQMHVERKLEQVMRKRWNANRTPIPRVFKLKLNQFHTSTERIYFRSKILCFDILVRFTHSRQGGKIEKKKNSTSYSEVSNQSIFGIIVSKCWGLCLQPLKFFLKLWIVMVKLGIWYCLSSIVRAQILKANLLILSTFQADYFVPQ